MVVKMIDFIWLGGYSSSNFNILDDVYISMLNFLLRLTLFLKLFSNNKWQIVNCLVIPFGRRIVEGAKGHKFICTFSLRSTFTCNIQRNKMDKLNLVFLWLTNQRRWNNQKPKATGKSTQVPWQKSASVHNIFG